MPDQMNPEIEHPALETEIERLAPEIQRQRELPEQGGRSGHELVRQAIQALPSSQATKAQVASDGDLPAYMGDAPAGAKLEVEHLLGVALHHGIDKANEEAIKSNNPYVMDAFHDALSGKLYEEFKRRGILD